MALRGCPICKNPSRNLWKHFHELHNNEGLSDAEFLCRYLGINEVPICQNRKCDKQAGINYSHYTFRKSCGSNSCGSVIRGHNGRIFSKMIVSNKICHCNLCNRDFSGHQSYAAHGCFKSNKVRKLRIKKTKEELHELAILRGKASVKARKFDGKNYYASSIEKDAYNRIKRLLPNLTIMGWDTDFHVSIYKPDIYIKELNLIIEIDGWMFHDMRKDIDRDKLINKLTGIKIRRFDSLYIKKYITDNELLYSILLESMQSLNYWERIPYDELGYWKWVYNLTGPRNLLQHTL